MTSITFTIAGIDRTSDISLDWSVEQVLTNEEDACSLVVMSGEKPVVGEELIVYSNFEKLFAGIIDVVKEEFKTDQVKFYNCSARDYSYMIDRRMVVETYVNQSADTIFRDIVSKYAAGFTVNNVKSGAPNIELMIFDYKQPTDCFKDLCEYVGWDWYVDYNKDLHFFNTLELADQTPIRVDENSGIRKLKHNIDTSALRNRVYVRGGTILSDPQVIQWKADGAARIWTLPWEPNEPALKVGEITKLIGIENVDDEGNFDYLINLKDCYIKACSGSPTLEAGTTLEMTAKQAIDVITIVEDMASQKALAAVQDGDGVYEHVIVDESLITFDAGEAAGMADLLQHANPNVKGSFQTEITGWAPGQLLHINLPNRGIEGVYIIQKISISPHTSDCLTYKVQYGGRLLGIADFLKTLISAQQNKKQQNTKILHKYVYGQDRAAVGDELITNPRLLPYICGAADGICGLVVVSS